LLNYWLERAPPITPTAQITTKFVYPSVKVAQIQYDPVTRALTPDSAVPGWATHPSAKLVAKPDQLIKRRGKAGLLALNKGWEEAKAWIAERAGKQQKVSVFFFGVCISVQRQVDGRSWPALSYEIMIAIADQ
jgi:ATP citrate (pro-S)-lyase